MKRTCISLLAVALACAGACNKDKGKDKKKDDVKEATSAPGASAPTNDSPTPVANVPSAPEDTSIDYDFLASVPADTPFLLAMIRPMPNDFLSYLRAGLTPVTGAAQLAISAGKEEADPMGRAILDELDGKLSIEGMRSLGIDATPKLAMYAIGLSFAMRVQLADGKAFSAMFDRVEKKGGQAMPKADFKGISYRHYTEDDGTLVVAIKDNQLILGFMHKAARDHVLPVLLGVAKPEKSIKDAGTVQTLVNKYKLMGMAMGFVDTVAVTRLLTGQASGLSKTIADVSIDDDDMKDITPACQSEVTQLAAAVPRMVVGYRNASAKGYESIISIEMRNDLAKDLAGLQTAGVAVDKLTAGKPVVAWSASLSLEKGQGWLAKKFSELATTPFKCEKMDDFNRDMAEAASDVKTPLPAFLAGAHGLVGVVKELRVAGNRMPTGSGYVALGVGDPMALLAELKQNVPPLANAQVEKGKMATVPVGLPGIPTADLLVGDKWLSVAVGAGMSEAMTSALNSKGKADGPFAVMAYDYAQLIELSAKMDPSGNPFAAQMGSMMGKFLGYSTTSVYFTDDGILGSMRTVID